MNETDGFTIRFGYFAQYVGNTTDIHLDGRQSRSNGSEV